MSPVETESVIREIIRAEKALTSEYKRLMELAEKGGVSGIPPLYRRHGSWTDERRKLVTLDHAIMAAHLFAARLCFKFYAEVVRYEIDLALKLAVTISLRVVGWIRASLGFTITFLTSIVRLMIDVNRYGEFEDKILDGGLEARRELAEELTLQSSRKRCRRYVSSRHFTPRQRKKNRNWRPC